MVGRFCHYYPGYTRKTALQEPLKTFFAMLRAIPALQAEDDLRAVMVAAFGANPGEKGRALRDFTQRLSKTAGHDAAPELTTLVPGVPGVMSEAEPGSIEALRERQRAAAERLEAERRAAWEANRRGEGGA